MKRIAHLFSLLILMAMVALPVAAQRSVERSEGYVDLKALGELDRFFQRDARMEVNVEGALMRLVEAASRQEDPELADLLARLDGVFVLGYELAPHSRQDFDELATGMGDDLRADGWTLLVRFSDAVENTHMFVRMDGDSVAGMVVMSVEEGSDQAVFVNIVGEIDPEQIGRIGQKFRIGGM